MRPSKPQQCQGKIWYNDLYARHLQREAVAAGLVASEKLDSIDQLLRRNQISVHTVAELGCGTGEVIRGCRARGIGKLFFAFDYSEDAVRFLSRRGEGIIVQPADITDDNFMLPRAVDLIVLSHVLEHLEQPLAFLRSCVRKFTFRYAVIEVPLERLPLMRLQTAIFGYRNTAGHVQFFTMKSFQKLIEDAGLRILDTRWYAPILSRETLNFIAAADERSALSMTVRALCRRWMPLYFGNIWRRLYFSHLAVLCTPAEIQQERGLGH